MEYRLFFMYFLVLKPPKIKNNSVRVKIDRIPLYKKAIEGIPRRHTLDTKLYKSEILPMNSLNIPDSA